MPPIKVLLADDSAIVRRAIRGLLEDTGIELVAEAEDFPQAIQLTNKLKPQVLVMDLHLKNRAEVSDVRPHLNNPARIIAISFSIDEEAKKLANQLGANAFLDKTALGDELIPTIKTFASNAN
jgi:DNA-binding NarL/FixJ family response regulator